MKPSQKCKSAGLSGLAELVGISGMKYRTLLYWAKNWPDKFDVVLVGAVASKPKSNPAYGRPVLIKVNGVIQHITYCFDESDGAPRFVPQHFGYADDETISAGDVDSWLYVDDVPL